MFLTCGRQQQRRRGFLRRVPLTAASALRAAVAGVWQRVPFKVSSRLLLLLGLVILVMVAQISLFQSWQQHPRLAASALSSEELLTAAIERLRFPPNDMPSHLVHELAVELGCSPPEPAAAATSRRPPPQRTVYVVTPTYRRPEQLAEMTRLAQTLMHVPRLRWIVVEDETSPTPLVTELLARTGIPYDHLTAATPMWYKFRKGYKARGVSNRNRGLAWIRANATPGVAYFGDDDNTYDIRLFEEMRSTRRVAMWPVGLVTETGLSTPVVADGKLVGFYDGWIGGRKFPVDMAGFAVSVEFLRQRPFAYFPYLTSYEEDRFLEYLAPFEPHEIELKAKNCTEILVWHTQTRKKKPSKPIDMEKYNNTNLVILKKLIV